MKAFLLFFVSVLTPILLQGEPEFSLDEAIAFTLENQLEIKISQLNIEAQTGVAINQGGPFDAVINLDGTATRMQDLQDPFQGIKTHISGYENIAHVNVNKTTRLGTSFVFDATLDQIKNPLLFPATTNISTISFFINQPLMRNLFNSLNTTNEEAAYLELYAVQYDSLQNISQQIFNTIFSYWEALGTYKALKINEEAIDRLSALKDKITKLIAEDQLAREDIRQPEQRIAARELIVRQLGQEYYEDIQNLKQAMGNVDINLQDGDIILLKDHFPDVLIDTPQFKLLMPIFSKLALTYRFDILAALTREDEADILLVGARNFVKPEVDLIGGVRHNNFVNGPPANHFFRPITASQPQVNWTIGIRISVPFENVAAIGLERQRAAQRLQATLQTSLLSQTVITSLRSAFENHLALLDQLKIARENVRLAHKLIEDETKKLPEGYSSLFILLDFEDRLTNALTAEVEIYKEYLQNIALLRFITGTLVCWDPETNFVKVNDAKTIPVEGGI